MKNPLLKNCFEMKWINSVGTPMTFSMTWAGVFLFIGLFLVAVSMYAALSEP